MPRLLSAWAAKVLIDLRRSDFSRAAGPAFRKLVEDAGNGIESVNPAAVKSGRLVNLIDVRSRIEFESSHIPGARNIPRSDAERLVERIFPDPTTTLVLYSTRNSRGSLVARNLVHMGYRSMSVLEGGLAGWIDAGYSLVSRREPLDDA